MKVLLVYPYLPHPDVSHGSGRVIVPLLRLWKDEAEITLICGYRPHESKLLDGARSLVHELIPVQKPLRSDRSTVGRAMESARTAILHVMRRDPIHVTKLDRAVFRDAIRKARGRKQFDVAQVELAGLARSVAGLGGIPSVLFDHEAGVASGGDLSSDPRSLRYIQAIYPKFSCVGTLCREDAAELSAVLPGEQIVVRRPGASPRPSTGEGRTRTVLFFGSPEHLPNRDALEWLAAAIWPAIIKKAPGARCIVAGGVSSPKLARAFAEAGIENRGFVQDLDAEIAKAGLVIAPVRLGRGVRMKNLDALSAGAPLVTTSIGARGLDLRNGEHALIADDAAGLANAAALLLGDRELAAKIGKIGQTHATRVFTHEAAAEFNLDLWKRLVSA